MFNVFACAYGHRYPSQHTQGHGTVGELYKVLNTSDPVWMLKRSYTDNDRQCVYTVMKSLKNFDYEFFKYYTDSNGIHKEHFYAELSAATGKLDNIQGAQFTVYKKKGEQPGTPYILVQWKDHPHCAILYYKESGTTEAKCEAHIWNQDRDTGMQQCLDLYNKYCPKDHKNNEQTVYHKDCRVDPGC